LTIIPFVLYKLEYVIFKRESCSDLLDVTDEQTYNRHFFNRKTTWTLKM